MLNPTRLMEQEVKHMEWATRGDCEGKRGGTFEVERGTARGLPERGPENAKYPSKFENVPREMLPQS